MTMEWEGMRSMVTVIAFATFIGIVAWAWSARKRGDFDAAARSVLLEDEMDQPKKAMNARGSGNERL